MALVKWKLKIKYLAEKKKTLEDLGNGMWNKDVAAKYNFLRSTALTWVKTKRKLTASLGKKRNELLKKKYTLRKLWKSR